ncbi:MAG: hypothetical protein ACYS0G_09920 [Planctomycetota bacterium]|jgi:uncharacterized tellurite resistance protein B-like protein
MEDTELLKAVVAVAVADGVVRRSEMGVVKGLAGRVGVGETSLAAMIEAAEQDESFADDIIIRSKGKARSAIKLLVGQARIDGEISREEREVIVRVAASLGITHAELGELFEAGIAEADRIRRSRKGPPG